MAWLTPYLMLSDWEASKRFYPEAFGFELAFEMPGPDGKPVHGEYRYKGQTLFMCAPEGIMGMAARSPKTRGSTDEPIGLYVYVDDVDAFAEKARSAGATVVHEPEDQFYGDRRVVIEDPSGYRWTFASNFKVMKPEDMKDAMAQMAEMEA
jgi:PhnB protein